MVSQVLFPHIDGLAKQPELETRLFLYDAVSHADIDWLLNNDNLSSALTVGLDTEFDGPQLGLIQLATEHRGLLIKIHATRKSCHSPRIRNPALEQLFANPRIRKTGCELSKDALLLWATFNHQMRAGVDLTALYCPSTLRSPYRKKKSLFALFSEMYLPAEKPLKKDKNTTTSSWTGEALSLTQLSYAILDAWVSYKVGVRDPVKMAKATVLDFANVDRGVLCVLAEHMMAALTEEHMRQDGYDSRFSTVTRQDDGNYEIANTQYRNKLMFEDKVLIELETGELRSGSVERGNHGKKKLVKTDQQLSSPVVSVAVVEQGGGRGADERLRDLFPSLILHGTLNAAAIPFFHRIFLRRADGRKADPVIHDLSLHNLNESQAKAVNVMLRSEKPVTLIHGPPGTGKTHTITAAVAASLSVEDHHEFYVLTCQTNAATRNLGVTLLKRGVEDFKIVVSDEFYVEWHEEEYKVIRDHVVKASDAQADKLESLIGAKTVVLCCLAQLSKENLIDILQARQITHLIIDEASQISLANLPHLLALYGKTLQRITFVGDPEQLAPYGNEEHPAVMSIFERHLPDVMLKEQYRMPNDLGSFISDHVYRRQLVSHKRPRRESSISFVDVASGCESKSGTGYQNACEADAVVNCVMSKFLDRDFVVITPYIAQREYIAARLREAISRARLAGRTDRNPEAADERVHTVDTVQGQEADVVVFSAVRTTAPGFLRNRRRLNVALTRAKNRLIVVARLDLFRNGAASDTLLGEFVREMEDKATTLAVAVDVSDDSTAAAAAVNPSPIIAAPARARARAHAAVGVDVAPPPLVKHALQQTAPVTGLVQERSVTPVESVQQEMNASPTELVLQEIGNRVWPRVAGRA
ncbi:hypothetical protein HDU87_003990 [Geranomyces variabilis]|uniref:AAA+ ATPase domain-containing protein n=1 Tax=Geranomyces variabilis TaxID=109894 RepID=A0AAD5XQZ2_9FUNG|nr:hypothetical protein HDU87_003990 [Geranomyces variabilis]